MCREKMIMEKNIFEINEITCFAYGKKNPQYFLIQPVNEPHAQMLDQQIRFMTEHTEKRFLLVSFLVKNWNQDLSGRRVEQNRLQNNPYCWQRSG